MKYCALLCTLQNTRKLPKKKIYKTKIKKRTQQKNKNKNLICTVSQYILYLLADNIFLNNVLVIGVNRVRENASPQCLIPSATVGYG